MNGLLLYLRQALHVIREERLFSGIYIMGTALALAFTMIMGVVYYIKLGPVYPERNRARTVYFDGITIEADNGQAGHTGFSTIAFEDWFQHSPNIEYCTPTLLAAGTGKTEGRCHSWVLKGEDEFLSIVRNETSADFFKIYAYDFVSGRPFTSKEVEGQEAVCVISDALAEQLFGRDVDAVGHMVRIEDGLLDLNVVGVVRGGSQLTPDSYADLIMPYTLIQIHTGSKYSGLYSIVATVPDNGHLQALKQELDEVAARIQQSHPEQLPQFNFNDKAKAVLTKHIGMHPMQVLRSENRDDIFQTVTVWQLVRHYAALLFVLLFVPSLNLCGIVAGRMERRSAEMAVRKTFGARRSTLIGQVMTENLVLTTLGGFIGLALSWLAIYTLRTEILGMFFDHSTLAMAPVVNGEMIFAPLLFTGAFAAILLLNVLAAVMPAWWSLRKPIVESMMEKR